ncbi:MAG TPA: VOC family protein [Acidimicrobiia bacterium]|nr:VOC family protein [Acidimicrobiia bacterium]
MFRKTKAFSGFSVDDIPEARKFYEETLGLDVSEEYGMLTLHIHEGGDIMIYPRENHSPAAYTILNFPVEDVDRAVDQLSERGVTFERYEGFAQDEKGIARGDEGPAIAWFTDRAGNILSVLEVN